jgi:hypothetical protein
MWWDLQKCGGNCKNVVGFAKMWWCAVEELAKLGDARDVGCSALRFILFG